MSIGRLVDTSLELVFDVSDTNLNEYEKEFNMIAKDDADAIGQWLRSAKAKGDTGDSDPVMLSLMAELYRKMDRLESLIVGNQNTRKPLGFKSEVSRIGVDCFELSQPLLEVSQNYYGRMVLPMLPQHETLFFFEALTPVLAKVTRIHTKNENEWGVYVAALDRALIRHLKGLE